MRIKKIWISKYKNIKNLNLDFSKKDHLITLLVGQNGLGKSNLIEILALIFRDLDLLTTQNELENWAYQSGNFEYNMTYICHENEVIIECLEGFFKIKKKNPDETFAEVSIDEFLWSKKDYLPNFIIGYYSGENKRVGEIIKLHERLELLELKNWQSKRTQGRKDDLVLRKLFFTESRHSQLLLLTLALYRNTSEYGDKISELFKNYLQITDLGEFTIRFKSPEWFKVGGTSGVDELVGNINKDKADPEWIEFPFWGLKGTLDQLLTRFYNHQIETKIPLLYTAKIDGKNREVIEFDNLDLKRFATELLDRFPHPIDFFSALEALDLVGILDSITVQIKKKGIKNRFSYEQLSEGEQQLITVLGLILITGKQDCLFLLDEPDTHLNPIWQRDFVYLLTEFNINDDDSHIIVATHSPLIVQSSDSANVVLFYENLQKKIKTELTEIPFHTWRLDHVVTSEYFGFRSARPRNEKLDQFMSLREALAKKEKLTRKDKILLKTFQDDFGFLPTGETFDDLEAMNFIHKQFENDKNSKA